jgi:LysM repeat protein
MAAPVPNTASMHRVPAPRTAAVILVAILGFLGIATTALGTLRVVVQPGETLSAIAARHGVGVATIAGHNGIRDANRVAAGRVIEIPGGLRGGGSSSAGGGTYTVRSGDTLSGIALRFGLSVGTLVRLNGLSSAHLVISGSTLRLGGSASSAGSSSGSGTTTGGATYTVQPGDSLGAIAARFGTSTSALTSANGLANPNVIVTGTRLRVPGGSAAPSQGPLTPVTAATSGWGSEPSRTTIAGLIATHSARYGVDPALVRAVAWQESGWWQGSRSSSGAIGVMQLMPATAGWLGPALVGRRVNPYDASDNIAAGTAYLGYLLRATGSRRLAIASYYQGMGSVSTRGLLPETEAYVASVASFIGRV